jgi:hypothetical protein
MLYTILIRSSAAPFEVSFSPAEFNQFCCLLAVQI